jgi:hypothetical protein
MVMPAVAFVEAPGVWLVNLTEILYKEIAFVVVKIFLG